MNSRLLRRRGLLWSLAGDRGMSVTELMVAICILAVAATAALPFYITALQQGRVVALILPRLHMIEANVTLFYILNDRLPSDDDLDEVLADFDNENLDIALAAGVITLKIRAPARTSRLNILDGKILLASPVVSKAGVASWHLDGELADRLRINY